MVFQMVLEKELTLTESSKSYAAWKHTTIPLYLDFYMFNWTNPEESLNNPKVKPILVEMGPYVFREEHEKLNLTWNANGTVSYWQRHTWHFEPHLSAGSLDDEITNVNVVAVTIATMAEKLDMKFADVIKQVINFFLKKTEKKLYIKKTVRELLFDGYEDGVLDLLKELEGLVKIPIQSRFGWFYSRNTSETYDGLVNIHSGVDDMTQLGMMGGWNYVNETKFFSGPCGKVTGSAGDLFPPAIAKEESFSIYATDLCSGIEVKNTHTDAVIKGLPGTVFAAGSSVFDNGTHYPENSCYCPNNKCTEPSGVRDLSLCKKGAPAFISFPHFYAGDPVYSEAIQGLRPNKSLHEFSMTIEKDTGIPLQVDARLQINILLKKIKGLDITAGLSHLVMPALWFHQHVTLPQDMADQLRPLCSIPMYAFSLALFLGLFGVLGLAVGVVGVKKGLCAPEQEPEPLLDDSRAEPPQQDTQQT